MTAQWESDGSPEISISADGTAVECNPDEHCGEVFNAIWKDSGVGLNSGSHYWQIHLSVLEKSSSIFVGLTDKDKFNKGWSLKGLLFGGPGNLSSGGCLLQSGYGPAPKAGNTIGIVAIFKEEQLKVYFDVDGKPLGPAFDLPATVLNGAFPAVHFRGKGKATISKCPDIPTNLSWKEPEYAGFEGMWKCTEFNGETPRITVTLKISKSEKDDNSYRIHLHVINMINFSLKSYDGKWKTTGGMSSRMGGTPENMELEDNFSGLFHTLCKAELDGIALVAANETIKSKWDRYSVPRSAVKKDPFN